MWHQMDWSGLCAGHHLRCELKMDDLFHRSKSEVLPTSDLLMWNKSVYLKVQTNMRYRMFECTINIQCFAKTRAILSYFWSSAGCCLGEGGPCTQQHLASNNSYCTDRFTNVSDAYSELLWCGMRLISFASTLGSLSCLTSTKTFLPFFSQSLWVGRHK